MNKKWLKLLGLGLVVIFFTNAVLTWTLSTSFTAENFPLSEKWSTRLGADIEQLSIFNNEIVFVRTCSGIYALDIESGSLLWQRHTGCWLANNEPALAKNGVVFFTDDKWIWALNQSDGEVLWQQRLHVPSAKVVDVSQDVVAVFDSQQISVFNANNGDLQWRKPVCRNSDQIYIRDNKLYFPCFGMTAVALDSGETIWEEKTERGIWITDYADDVMYSSPDNKNVTAYSLVSRKQLWSIPLPTDGEQGFKAVDEFLFVIDGTHFCVLLRNDGRKLWCADKMLNPQNPTRVGDTIYIFNGPQNIITAFDIRDGNQLGRLKLSSFRIFTIFRQLMVSSDELLIFVNGQEIFAFGKSSK